MNFLTLEMVMVLMEFENNRYRELRYSKIYPYHIYLLMDFESLHRTAMSPGTAIPLATCQMMIQTWIPGGNQFVLGDDHFECNCAFLCFDNILMAIAHICLWWYSVWLRCTQIYFWLTLWLGKSMVYFPSSESRKRETNKEMSPKQTTMLLDKAIHR